MTKIERFKNHVREHKELYIGIAIGVTITAIGYAISKSTIRVGDSGITLRWKSDNIYQIYLEPRGLAGYVTRDLKTGIPYSSQNLAADVEGVSHSAMSAHINKGTPLPTGGQYERVTKMK